MYDPTAVDTPHLSGAQPTWGDLPYACEMLQEHWEAEGQSADEISEGLASRGERNKVKQLQTLLGPEKLGLLRDDGTVTGRGVWIASNFEPSSQQGLSGEPGLSTKEALSAIEQATFGLLLFERNWVPMLATVNVLATEAVAARETEARAAQFQDRIAHLEGYRDVESINSWKKKVQAHLQWAEHLNIAYENAQGELELTGFGHQLHEQVQSDYHPDWP